MDCRPYYPCSGASDGCGPLFTFFVRLDRHFGHHTNVGHGDVRYGTSIPSDFRLVLQHPKDILVGELAQFLIMPSLVWLLCKLLSLPEELALGVILVGCCPGGTASNVICYLAKVM